MNQLQLEKKQELLKVLKILEKEKESYNTVIYSLTRKREIEEEIMQINDQLLMINQQSLQVNSADKSIEEKREAKQG
jgi:hypothetical protein